MESFCMESRGRKRTEMLDQLPADKRACSAPDHEPSSSSQIPSESTNLDHQMELPSSPSVSGRSDKESAYGSCDSDGPDQDYHHYYRASSEARSKFQKILASLSNEAGKDSHLAALMELCDSLLLCTESSLSGFSWEAFVPILITFAKHDSNPDIMLFATRALTYLCDVMPRSSMYLVRHDAVPALVAPLLGIEYLDLAEQCVEALERISRVQPGPCLQAGAVMAVLNYIDFFPPSIQRLALSTVMNICKKLPADSYSYINGAIPVLCNILQDEDPKLVDGASMCLILIGQSADGSSEMIDHLCRLGFVQQAVNLILSHRVTLGQSTYIGLIGFLGKLATVSCVVAQTLLELNISSTLKNILVAAGPHTTPAMDTDQVNEVLKLMNALLPPLDDRKGEHISEKHKMVIEHPELLYEFGRDMLPSLTKVVSSGASSYIVYGSLCILNKLIYYIRLDMLVELLNMINISSFLAGVFARKNRHVLILALKTAELVLRKLPLQLLSSFTKEGVLSAISALQMSEQFSCLKVQKTDNRLITSETGYKRDGSAKEMSRCLCHAFDVCISAEAHEATTCKAEFATVQAVARQLKENYFAEVSSISSGLSQMHQILTGLSQILSNHVKDTAEIDVCHEQDILKKIIAVISNTCDSMSTFEFVESGIVKSLSDYLFSDECRRQAHDDSLPKRYEIFARVCLLSENVESENVPMLYLLQKLQGAFCSLEHFTLVLNQPPKVRAHYANIPCGHYTKHPCLKILFVKGEGETLLSDYSEEVKLVEPCLSLVDIEKFLWPKVSIPKEEKEMQKGAENAEEPTMESHEHDRQHEIPANMRGESASFSPGKKHLIFFLDGKQLNRSLTLYQSILQHLVNGEHDVTTGPRFWNETYKLTYRKAANIDSDIGIPTGGQLGVSWKMYSEILLTDLPFVIEKSGPARDILVLFKILEAINRHGSRLICHGRILNFAQGKLSNLDEVVVMVPTISHSEFLSSKLSEKLKQQMQDPLAICPGTMPAWCSQLIAFCPFLFSFEARRKYFSLAAFTSHKASQSNHQLHRTSVNSDDEYSSSRLLRTASGITRERLQVDRADIMGSAVQIMDRYAGSDVVLEVEYKEEVGSGLGPTSEFYTLTSHEFQKIGLDMWRDDCAVAEDSSGILAAPFGLFPRPWSDTPKNHEKIDFSIIKKKFVLLGQVVAKALQDGRVLDLPFSKAFYKVMLNKDLDIYDILSFDPALGRTLLQLRALANRKRYLDSLHPGNSLVMDDLDFYGSKIEDLCLEFALPGYSNYVLACRQENTLVSVDNLDDYVSLVVEATVKSGICRQIEAFKEGFNQVFPLSMLQIFSEEEIECLLCGELDAWTSEKVLDHIAFDHGYTASSLPIIYLLEIIREFKSQERQAFCQFVTGAPRLPSGGLAALRPRLTIVRKHCDGSDDGNLPSVMTCANFLKLPAYSSKEQMRERLSYAITEGQGSFHLS